MSSKLKYISYGKSVDGTAFCSGVETLAENMIEDNEEDQTLIFPSATGWATMRSESLKMTTANVEIFLPAPIYKMRKIMVVFDDVRFSWGTGGSASWSYNLKEFKNSQGNIVEEVDITEYVLEDTDWDRLYLASGGADSSPYIGGIYKDNTFHFGTGTSKIPIANDIFKIGVDSIPIIMVGADDSPVYERLLRSILSRNEYKSYVNEKGQTLAEAAGADIGSAKTDPRQWQYRIEYVPISPKTKLRARKSAKTNVEYMQPFNQRAEINAVSAFGKNMHLTAQKTGVKTLTLVKYYEKLKDIPPKGAKVLHDGKFYRLVANSYQQTDTVKLKVTHVLSENWSSKSKHISVDQKYRNWAIPQDILWRNLYWEDYIVFSTENPEPLLNTTGMYIFDFAKAFKTDISKDKAIDTLFWDFVNSNGNKKSVMLPCSTFALGNSMVFTANFKDNLSAGLCISSVDDWLCEDVFYCNEDGTLDTVTVTLSAGYGIGTYDEILGVFRELENGTLKTDLESRASSSYPMAKSDFVVDSETGEYYTLNAPKYSLFKKEYKILKDPGEALRYTYQVHFVSDDGNIVVGHKFAELNPLIKKWDKNRVFRLCFSKKYFREGEDKILFDENIVYNTQSEDGQYFDCSTSSDGVTAHVYWTWTLEKWAKDPSYIAWAITDEEGSLYVARNDRITEFYMALKHTRQ